LVGAPWHLATFRSHSGEFDGNYMQFLRDAFSYYGEDRVFLFCDATPYVPLVHAAAPSLPVLS